MKNIRSYLLLLTLPLLCGQLNAQMINWASMEEDYRHIANVNFGAEYGMVYGLSYGYHFNTLLFSFVPGVEFSFPSGNRFFDDYKSKIGTQIQWFEYQNFQMSTRIHGVFRRYENDFVRLLNFGSDLALVMGYYDPRWFAAGEFGFDKAIVTNFKHTDMYRNRYPGAVDGWYEPPTGGNFYFGIQVGYSFKQHDIYLRGGKTYTQDFITEPFVPFYGQIGYNIKFGNSLSDQ